MNKLRIYGALLLALAGASLGHAQTNVAGAGTVITIQQGTNVIRLEIVGTNGPVTIRQGANLLWAMAPATNAPVMVARATNTVILAKGAKPLPKPDTNHWASVVTAGLTLTRGNSDVLLYTAKIASQKKGPVNEYDLEADAAYGKNNGVESADTTHGSAQYNHLYSPRAYFFANSDGLHDGIQDIQYRFSVNPGAGYYFIKTKPTSLMGELGPGIVTEKLADVDTTYASMRAALHLDEALTPTAKLWEKAELISQVSDPDNYYVNAELGIETAITKKLSLQVTLDDNYVNRPASERVPNDVKLVSGIAYKF